MYCRRIVDQARLLSVGLQYTSWVSLTCDVKQNERRQADGPINSSLSQRAYNYIVGEITLLRLKKPAVITCGTISIMTIFYLVV